VEGELEKILLESFSPTLRPISSDIKHGQKSLPLKSIRERMNKGRETQDLLPQLLTEKNIYQKWLQA